MEKKLFERTKILCSLLKNRQPQVKIISPSITIIDERMRSRYLDYLVHNRNFFEYHGLNCCHDMKEQTMAVLTSFLSEMLRLSRKEVWITRWSVPSSYSVVTSNNLGGLDWQVPHPKESALLLKSVFSNIETITKGNSKWFFSGTSKDEYHPAKKIPTRLWQDAPHILRQSDAWDYSHFLGSISYDDKLKEQILDTLKSLHEQSIQ